MKGREKEVCECRGTCLKGKFCEEDKIAGRSVRQKRLVVVVLYMCKVHHRHIVK